MKKIILGLSHENVFSSFVGELLEDVPFEKKSASSASDLSPLLHSAEAPDLCFIESGFLTAVIAQKIKALKTAHPKAVVVILGAKQKEFSERGISDLWISEAQDAAHFLKQVLGVLPYPDPIKIVIADDEKAVGDMVSDYFSGRQNPSFEVRYGANGKIADTFIREDAPHILILDIKMPELDGRELYCQLHKEGRPIPTIVFFDAISGFELNQMRKCGNPVVIEKGSPESSMAAVIIWVKKLAFFAE